MAGARLATHPKSQRALEDATPPKGWWGRLRRWFRPPRKLRLTREGKYFIGITFGVGFAASMIIGRRALRARPGLETVSGT